MFPNSSKTRWLYCSTGRLGGSNPSIQNVALTDTTRAFGPPVGVVPVPVRNAMLSVPPPTLGTEPATLVSDVTLSTVVLTIVA
jgi:hypothetical protein